MTGRYHKGRGVRLGEVRQGDVTRVEEGGAVDRAGVLVRSAAVDCRL